MAQERSSWRGKCRAGLEEATRKRVEEDELKCTANAMKSAGGSDSVAATKPSSKWVAFFQGSRCACKCVYVCFVYVCVYASVYVCFVYVCVFVCVGQCSQTSSWCPMEAALG